MATVAALKHRIDEAMLADRHRLRSRLRSLEQAQWAGQPFDRHLARLNEELERSVAQRAERRANLPRPQFDDQLPVTGRRDEIAQAIAANPVVILCGETGSGKSTQLPKICLDMGRGVDGMIGHTQPRRIAARSVAARIAEELGSTVGRDVGFKVRFTDTTSPRTYVKLMTDGVLLAESQHDRFLSSYDTIIVDEAHERSLNIDLLLGFLKRLLPSRPDLRLIITSATIDVERYAAHFGRDGVPAPVIEVSGRTYPVEVRYRPLEAEGAEEEPDVQRSVVAAVDELAVAGPGDMLIFMPTERDILETAKTLRGHCQSGRLSRSTEIVPLYARLSTAEQNRIFQPHSQRRIVIATNVAESSLTVPGIRSVIDSGTARISRYSARSKVQRLPIEAISQASADQRKGRCGRIGPGICIRLYGEDDYLTRDRFTAPEIQRSNLASVILQIKALKFGEIEDFPFLDPPRPEGIRDGYRTLFELGAIDEARELTPLGRQLSRLPVDPRIGRIIVSGDAEACLAEILIIAAALEAQDPRERPLEKQQAADESHAEFADEQSDFLSYLKLWDFYHGLKQKLSQNQLRKACKQRFLSYTRLREWSDLHRQLAQLVEQAGLKQQARKDDYTTIHRALLSGFLSSVAFRPEAHEYTVAGGQKAQLWPGSGTFQKKPRWIIAGEVVETTRRYVRTVGRIDPAWIESLAGHLLNYSHSEVHWDRAAASAMAFERVSLFGLVIVPRRRVRYGRIDPTKAREIFLQHALVEGDYETRAPFFKHNQEVVQRIAGLENKSRTRGLLAEEEARLEFYDRRIPAEVVDGPSFERWRRGAEREEPRRLFAEEKDFLQSEADVRETDFPDELPAGPIRLPLEYAYEPGAPEDGVTLSVPQEALAHVDAQRLGWLVPGLIEEKIAALIKTLPKETRRHFVPAPDTARRVVAVLPYGQGDFLAAVAQCLGKLGGVRVAPANFDETALPDYLRINVRVLGAKGECVASSRDVQQLREQMVEEIAADLTAVDDPRWKRDGLNRWDFGELPRQVEVRRAGFALPAFPAIVDQQQAVGLRLASTADAADWETRRGLRRLAVLYHGRELKAQIDWLPDANRMKLLVAGSPVAKDWRDQLMLLLADRAYLTSDDLPRDEASFQFLLKQGKLRLVSAVREIAAVLPALTANLHAARLALETAKNLLFRYAIDDMRSQFEHLATDTLLTETPWTWLEQTPRYFKAIVARLDKLGSGGLARDQKAHAIVAPRWQKYLERAASDHAQGLVNPQLAQYRWMLEEFRVSQFAQQLGTAIPISEKRLDEQWKRV